MSWKKSIVIGLTLGTILGAGAYIYLWTVGNQLEAQRHAERIAAQYSGAIEQKARGEAYKSLETPIGTYMIHEESTTNQEQLQPAQGYRYYMKNMVENDSGTIQGGDYRKYQATLYADDIQGMR